jgi:hypothetical protein
MKTVILLVGLLALVIGLFWAGQGYGLIQWPPPEPGQFTMVGHSNWIYIGLGVAVGGLVLIVFARRNV